MSQDYAILSFHDYDGEPTRMNVNTIEIDATNLAAQETLLSNLRIATNNISLGTVEQAAITDITWDTVTVTTNPFAQREIKWVVIVQDTNGDKYKSNEVPMADLDLLENNSKYIIKNGSVAVSDPNGYVAAWKTAYEAFAVSPTGAALTVLDMYQVGRNT